MEESLPKNMLPLHDSTMQEAFDQEVRTAKKELFEAVINAGGEAFVAINPGTEGVRLLPRILEPAKEQPEKPLVLKFSSRYEYRLEILEEGVEQILRFGAEDFPVFVAWDAIYAIEEQGGRKAGWPFHGPPSVRLPAPICVGGGDIDDVGPLLVHPDGRVEPGQSLH